MANNLRMAHSFFERMKGLIGSQPLEIGEGFLIPYCQGVHSFGMSYDIDVLYLDGDGKVLYVGECMKPNQFGKVCFQSKLVLELPSGMIALTHTEVGDTLMMDYDGSGTLGDQKSQTSLPLPTILTHVA